MTSSPATRRTGWVLSALVTLILVADGLTGLLAPQALAESMAATGWPAWSATAIGAVALLCGILYAVPQTAGIGAILVTGFVGGAISTHLRVGDAVSPEQIFCALLGVAAWGGLYLRRHPAGEAVAGHGRLTPAL